MEKQKTLLVRCRCLRESGIALRTRGMSLV